MAAARATAAVIVHREHGGRPMGLAGGGTGNACPIGLVAGLLEGGVDATAVSTSSGAPYRIGERRLIDGGYRRNENADLAAGHDDVLVMSPHCCRSPPARAATRGSPSPLAPRLAVRWA